MPANFLTRLFTIQPKAPAAPAAPKGHAVAAGLSSALEDDAPPPPPPPPSGPFISPQSLMNFPVAAFIVKLAWDVAKSMDGDAGWAESNAFVIWPALVVGGLVFLINLQGGKLPETVLNWVIATGVGLINCLVLAASALGINVALPPGGAPPASPPAIVAPAATPVPNPAPPVNPAPAGGTSSGGGAAVPAPKG